MSISLGVEYGCRYVLERPNGFRAVFNDSTDADFVGTLGPESSGLDAPELREDSADRVENDGAIFGDFFAGKRAVVLQGEINASSPTNRNEKVSKLRKATNAKRDDATLTWEPQGTGQKVFVKLRRAQPLRVTKGYVKEFQASMVAADSRILSSTLQGASKTGVTALSQEKLPGTATSVVGEAEWPPYMAGLPQIAWTSPNNIKLTDTTYATVNSNTVPQLLVGSNYGFVLPTNAIVTGVEAKIKHKAATAGKWQTYAFIISRNITSQSILTGEWANNEGHIPGGLESKFSPPWLVPTVEETRVVGSSGNLWNYITNLSRAVINSSTFGFGVQYTQSPTPGTLSVDSLALKVYFVEPPEVTVTNEGDADSPAVIEVTGPYENFYIQNNTTGEIMQYNGVLAAGRLLTFDSERFTCMETGTGLSEGINRFGNITFPNDWIQIHPGANRVVAGGLGGSAATKLQVNWRHAWE